MKTIVGGWLMASWLAAASLMAIGCSKASEPCLGPNDIRYDAGDTFVDGCNNCVCNEDGSITCDTGQCAVTCEFAGEIYQPGQAFPAGDGCNVCSCGSDGSVTCTDSPCGSSCVYAGVQRAAGETFPALDGCNTCTCESDGNVSCTELACACDAASEWWRDYVETDPGQCAVINYTCPPNTISFENSCGCGCEQSATCAESYDCAPPNQCDVAQIQADCPYSTIVTM
jgi:hypothetical protein